ncbi:dTDP-4-dehydrorhamnose 3,5-epimerase family protein [Candidatus Woesebacteria bacterium]|nr:MAG: dTDP-4-dehydrorhamnose 3,5-epimerase family protein [Candidatus Woesebacteria bacterium]
MENTITVKKTSIEGVFIIEKPVYYDERGFFMKYLE